MVISHRPMSQLNRSALRKSDLREANQRLVLNILRQNPGTSRADLVRVTGFSASSVTFVVNRMLREGLLSETNSAGSAQVGRRPLMLHLRSESLVAAGVEITPGEGRVAIADLQGKILKQRAVPWQADYHLFLARIRNTIRALAGTISKARLLGVGVSLPGTIDRHTGRVIAAENLGWFDVEAGRILSEGIPQPFYFENDAKSRALVEQWFCEPGSKPIENFVFVALRPGLGTGVVSGGRLLQGASGAASEFGHTSLYPEGRRCPCGGIGCWEEYAAERAVERIYAERCGNAANGEEIVRLARAGDALALDVLRECATYLGMGFANLNAAFDPEAIIVGDYLASAWDLMKDWVWAALRSRTSHRYLTRLRIIPSTHGRDSALKGALALVLSDFFGGTGAMQHHSIAHRPVRTRRIG